MMLTACNFNNVFLAKCGEAYWLVVVVIAASKAKITKKVISKYTTVFVLVFGVEQLSKHTPMQKLIHDLLVPKNGMLHKQLPLFYPFARIPPAMAQYIQHTQAILIDHRNCFHKHIRDHSFK